MRKLPVLLAALLSIGAAREVRVVRETETTRTAEHTLGETEIPASPQRIIGLNGWLTDPLLALGVTPAGMVSYIGVDDAPPYAEAHLEGVPRVGTWETPDLIIASEPQADGFGAQRARIAPAVHAQMTLELLTP